MRKMFKRVLEILDGTPAEYGQRREGQSLVEMTLIIPLLVIMIVGIAEIGWLANNYLTLQEVTRVGARRGTVLTQTPIDWENDLTLRNASILPGIQTGGVSIDPEWDGLTLDEQTFREGERVAVRQCDAGETRGFYDEILCTMLNSMEPLPIRLDNGVDDIAISVFAIQIIHNSPTGDIDLENLGFTPLVPRDEFQPGYIPVVVGRYPSNANECNIRADGTLDNDLERDPFDWLNNGVHPDARDFDVGGQPVRLFLEEESQVRTYYDGNETTFEQTPEQQRGFVYSGQHKVESETDAAGNQIALDCYGSEFSIYEVQELLTVPTFEMTPDEITSIGGQPGFDQGEYLPNLGLVLVEMWWEHELLLDIPFYNPVFQALEDQDRTTIYVWAAFPVPAVEPSIQFQPDED